MTEPTEAAPAATPAPAPARRDRRILAIPAVVAFIILSVAARFLIHGLSHESTDDAFIEGHVVPVTPRIAGHIVKVLVDDNQLVAKGQPLVELDRRDLDVRLAAARAALDAATGHARAARAQAAWTRATGDAGIAAATSSVEAAHAGVESARAQIGTAKARLEQAKAEISVVEASVDQAKADATAAEADEVRLVAEKKRYEDAVADDSVSHQEVDRVRAEAATAHAKLVASHARVVSAEAAVREAHAAVDTAASNVKQMESQLAEALARRGEAEAHLESARAMPHQVEQMTAQADSMDAEVARARAALAQAELDLSYATIAAPEAGRVTQKSVEVGGYVTPGQPLLALVSSEVWVVANFKETQLRDMKVGQKVEVRADASPDHVLFGHVESLQAGTGSRFSLLPPENATGNYVKVVQRVPVKIAFDEPVPAELRLAPGMSVEPEVETR